MVVVAADPALARVKHKLARHCVDQTADGPSLYGFFFNPPPQPNGCAPPVYAYGHYVGQDPDPYIRQQLNRDPQTGYTGACCSSRDQCARAMQNATVSSSAVLIADCGTSAKASVAMAP